MSSAQAEALDPGVLVQENTQLKSTIVHLEALVDKLQYQLAQLTRRQFGVCAEGQAQLGLFLAHELPESASTPPVATQHIGAHERARPVRRALPADLPREVIVLDLKPEDKPCPCCGEPRHEIGEEISEKLDIEPAKMTVLQYRRKKYACRGCEGEIQVAPLPAQLIEQGLATPGLLAHVAVSKYCDHQPLARQEKIFARQGIELPRSTMSDWMLATGRACEPLVERMSDLIKAQDIVCSDDTVLPYKNEERSGKTTTARLWVWRAVVQDKPLLVYQFTEDRSGDHPRRFLQDYRGYLQADAYAGYDAVFAGGRIIEVGCMAHARRKFFEVAKTAHTPGFAHEAVQHIAQLYAIERRAKEQVLKPPEIQALRARDAPPILATLKARLEAHWPKLPPKGPLAQAIGYMLRQWEALTRYRRGRTACDRQQLGGERHSTGGHRPGQLSVRGKPAWGPRRRCHLQPAAIG